MRRSGMTFNELMIVVTVVGVTAGLAIPMYIRTVEKVRGEGAVATLQLLRSAERVYYFDEQIYTELDGTAPDFLVDGGYIQDPNAGNSTFDYVVTVDGTGANFGATATRNAGCNGGVPAEYITIDQNGTVDASNWTPACIP